VKALNIILRVYFNVLAWFGVGAIVTTLRPLAQNNGFAVAIAVTFVMATVVASVVNIISLGEKID
jgi:hypothetical protein